MHQFFATPEVAPYSVKQSGNGNAEVRGELTLIRHLPKDHRNRSTWSYVAAQIDEAVAKGDTKGVAIALRMVLMLEGVEWRPG